MKRSHQTLITDRKSVISVCDGKSHVFASAANAGQKRKGAYDVILIVDM